MYETRIAAAICLFLALSCTPSGGGDAPESAPEPEGVEPAPAAEAAAAAGSAEGSPTAEPEAGGAEPAVEEPAADGSAAAAVQEELPEGWTPVAMDGLTSEQFRALVLGRRTRAEVATRLVNALVEAMGRGTPAAIPFCNTAAPGILDDSVPANVRLGRTSHRLRNAANAPPAWAASHVAAQAPTPLLAIGPEGQVAELVPINTVGLCLECHGAPETIAPPVSEVLREMYPDDQAVGFAENDLRGWFWFEVAPG